MKRGSILLFCMALVRPAPAAAAAGEFHPPAVTEWTLANGLQVVHVAVPRAPVVSVQVWYRAGTRDEPKGRRGMARLFERLLFAGSQRVRPDEHSRMIDDLGGKAAAFTAEDTTAFQDTLPAQYLDFALELEAERMRGMVFRQSALTAARDALKADLREKVDGSPVGSSFVRARELLFAGHQYMTTPTGNSKDLDQVTLAELKKFYDTYYRPNNAVLVIAGDVSAEEAKTAVAKWFGPLAKGPDVPAGGRGEALPPIKAKSETIGNAGLGVVMRGYRLPALKADDMVPLRVLASVLSDGEQARLIERLVSKNRVAEFANVQVDAHQDGGLFLIIAVHGNPKGEAKLKDALDAEVAAIQKDGVTEAELRRARNQLAATFIAGLEDATGVGLQAGASKLLRGDAAAWTGDYAGFLAVTSDDLKRVATTYLPLDQSVTILVTPGAQ